MPKIFVVLPTYNEADNLPLLAAELQVLNIPGLAILVVDDNSPDGTGQIADELARKRPGELFVLHRRRRTGLGAAYVAGFQWALNHGADVIFQMDCDFSHAPGYIPHMLRALQKADVVVGSRFVRGGQIDERWNTGRYLLSWWANAVYARLLLNLSARDATAGFKCWRASALRAINLDNVSTYSYCFQIEMAYLAEKLGLRVREIPIYFEDRRIGRSRLPFSERLRAAFHVFRIMRRYRNLTPIVPG